MAAISTWALRRKAAMTKVPRPPAPMTPNLTIEFGEALRTYSPELEARKVLLFSMRRLTLYDIAPGRNREPFDEKSKRILAGRWNELTPNGSGARAVRQR